MFQDGSKITKNKIDVTLSLSDKDKSGATLEDPTSQTYDENRIMNKADIVKWGVNMIAGFADAGVSVAGEI